MSLSTAFDEIVWKAPEKGRHSGWALLAKAGYDAYWSAWMHLLEVGYCDHASPAVNQQIKVWLGELKGTRRLRSAGRRKGHEVEHKRVRRRLKELLKWSEGLHTYVRWCNARKLTRQVTEQRVFQRIEKERHDHNILSGKAFSWSKNRIEPVLHNSQSWKPRELAVSLLSLELNCDYDTVIRKIGQYPRKKRP